MSFMHCMYHFPWVLVTFITRFSDGIRPGASKSKSLLARPIYGPHQLCAWSAVARETGVFHTENLRRETGRGASESQWKFLVSIERCTYY